MIRVWSMILILCVTIALTGCIGEDYDFTPPTITLLESEIELAEANVDWIGENNEPYKKETKDLDALTKKQEIIYVFAGQQTELLFDHTDFIQEHLSVFLLKDGEKIELGLQDNSFYFPDEKGEYTLVVELVTDRGKVEYAGNVQVVWM